MRRRSKHALLQIVPFAAFRVRQSEPATLRDPVEAAFASAAISEETAGFNLRLEEDLAGAPTPMDVPIPEMRAARAAGRGIIPLYGPREKSHWAKIEGPGGPLNLRITDPPGAPRGVYLHVHGGGWTFGSPEQSDEINARIAEATGALVVSVKYRLGPENRWPAPLDDCVAAAQWVLAKNIGPVVIGGESAGAHLAASTLLWLRDNGLLRGVVGAALTYGMYDLNLTPSAALWGERYLILSSPIIRWFVGNLMGDQDPAQASTLCSDLRDLVPAQFVVGTEDPLLDDTLFMAARWQVAQNPAELRVVPGGIHAFDQFDLAIAREALASRHHFIKSCLEQT